MNLGEFKMIIVCYCPRQWGKEKYINAFIGSPFYQWIFTDPVQIKKSSFNNITENLQKHKQENRPIEILDIRNSKMWNIRIYFV
jgi:hypothetical protein